jgi:hypothetical protein
MGKIVLDFCLRMKVITPLCIKLLVSPKKRFSSRQPVPLQERPALAQTPHPEARSVLAVFEHRDICARGFVFLYWPFRGCLYTILSFAHPTLGNRFPDGLHRVDAKWIARFEHEVSLTHSPSGSGTPKPLLFATGIVPVCGHFSRLPYGPPSIRQKLQMRLFAEQDLALELKPLFESARNWRSGIRKPQ